MSDPELMRPVRALYAAFNRRDWDAFFADADPEVEWAPLAENVCYRGRPAITAHFERRLAAWMEFRLELEELELSAFEDRVLAAARYEGRVRDSDKVIGGLVFSVIELRDGRFWRGEEYADKGQARAAFEWRD